jgi:glycosyltransferase involved in cell wall biosynthesis
MSFKGIILRVNIKFKMKNKSKIAVVHGFLDNIGGAEKLALTVAKEIGADVITTNVDIQAVRKMGFQNVKIISIGKVPKMAPFRQQKTNYLFRTKKIPCYDVYIVIGDWAMGSLVKNKPNIWYIQSPIREIWDLYESTRKIKVKFWERPLFDMWVKYNRYLSRKYVGHANILLTNSKNTQARLKKFLNKDSEIVHPGTDLSRLKYKQNGDYWLAVNRLIDHKRVHLQMQTFTKMSTEKLVIVGSYEDARQFKDYKNYVESIKPSNVEIRSFVSDEELCDLYANCKAFITTAKDEDYGMTPVEAMAAGKPVVATNEGGYKETVVHGETGLLVNADVDELVKAVKEISKNPKKYRFACEKRAKLFSKEICAQQIMNEVKKLIGDKNK